MGDLIDRSKLPTIRISIPAYLVDDRCRSVVEIVSEGFQTLIESAPTVDAVEVVRCERCIHWGVRDGVRTSIPWCTAFKFATCRDFYCRYGSERRKNS